MSQDPKLTKNWSPGVIRWTYDGELNAIQAQQKQLEASYHPAGYGFSGYKVSNGVTTWSCSNSCD
jgi:hypothetical protein